MGMNLPFIAYPPAQDGYWSPVTSTLNWCEEDYYATIYSAEIINTLTNLLFMFLAIRGARSCIRNDHDQIFLVAFVGYFLVGTGSFLFHTTLKYPMQLVDELSMIYTTCLMFYATFSHRKSHAYSVALGCFLITIALGISLYYHYLQDPTFHQNAYAVLTAIVLFRSMYIMEINIRPALNKKSKEKTAHLNGVVAPSQQSSTERARQDIRDEKILRNMWMMVAYGLAIFLGGFAIWNLDNIYCGKLRQWRREVGLPWGILLEGHGWWHLMTGTGAYFYIIWGIWLRHCLNGRQDEFELVWPRLFTSLPNIERRYDVSSTPVQNGTVKKNI
ncbi:alkaline ceramidase-like protein [Patellaria atrata CBS 101060]|uniref:Alkaline ceramidase-like protein n=1 Tax=Patellaria atrata CBS 101060 TaxID=1346257 RepID=A0A9P4VUF2_9PEZI|nr:alkaline ceramidase-like protein [Patellaria atrata CBS 101060]